MGNELNTVAAAVENLAAISVRVAAVRKARTELRAALVSTLDRVGEHPAWDKVPRPGGVKRVLDGKAFKVRYPEQYAGSREFIRNTAASGPWPLGDLRVVVSPVRSVEYSTAEYRQLLERIKGLESEQAVAWAETRALVELHREALEAAGAWSGEFGVRYADGRRLRLGYSMFKRQLAEQRFPDLVESCVVEKIYPEGYFWRIRGLNEEDDE